MTHYLRFVTVVVLVALVLLNVSCEAPLVTQALAEAGNAAAQYNLGVMYDNGQGVPQDDVEAVRWLRLAADQGYVSAQLALGVMYASGQGVPQDYVQAHMWFNLAASVMTGEDRERIVEIRDQIEEGLTPDGISEAQRLAREWDAAHPR